MDISDLNILKERIHRTNDFMKSVVESSEVIAEKIEMFDYIATANKYKRTRDKEEAKTFGRTMKSAMTEIRKTLVNKSTKYVSNVKEYG